jgi:glutamyl-tRNA synthetase
LLRELENLLKYLPNGSDIQNKLNATTRAQLLKAMPGLKERAKTLLDLIDGAHFIFADRPLVLDPKAVALVTPETRALIGELKHVLQTVSPWTMETTETAVRNFAEINGLKLGAAAQPLRVALTGRTTSPGIFEVLDTLGREECLARLADLAAA